MNLNTIKALLLATGAASILQTANAAPLTYTADDLFLGFRSSNSTTDFLLNIGQASIYRDALPNSSFQLSIGSILADLDAVFGSNWNDVARGDIFWGVAGTNSTSLVAEPTSQTLYASSPEGSGTPAAPGSTSTQAAPANRIVSLSGKYLSYADSNGGVSPAVNTAGVRQDGTEANTWQAFMGGTQAFSGNSFSYFSGGIENNFGAGNEAANIDLYRISRNPNGVASLEGTFSINDAGIVTFTNGIIPEPTSALLLTLGASVIGFSRRRRA